MANGDIAAAAGLEVVPSSDPRAMGYDEINYTRDALISGDNAVKALIPAVWPTVKGGTGASNVYAVTIPSAGANTGVMVIRSDGKIARGDGALPPSYIPSLGRDELPLIAALIDALTARIDALTARVVELEIPGHPH